MTTYEAIYAVLKTAILTTGATILPAIDSDEVAYSGNTPNALILVGDESWENDLTESGRTPSIKNNYALIAFSIAIYAKCQGDTTGDNVRAKIGELGDKLRAGIWAATLPTTYNTSTVGAVNVKTKIIGVQISKVFNAPMYKENRLQILAVGNVKIHIQ